MCITASLPGRKCSECGKRDTLTFYESGYVRGVVRHKCTRPAPGPPTPPVIYPEHARQQADPDYKIE